MTERRQRENGRSVTDEELREAVPRESGASNARVGVFVLLGLISFVIVLFWMTDPATFRGRYKVVTTVENAGGVRAGDPIQMYGINLGRVHDFELTEPGRVHITMEIEGRWEIPADSRTSFGASGVFGGRTLVIEPGESSQMLQPWDTIPGESASGEGLLGSVDDLSGQAGTVMDRIMTLLDQETVGSVQGSARELEGLLAELSAIADEQRGGLRELTQSLRRSAAGLEDATAAGPEVARAIARADSAMAALESTSRTLDEAAGSLREMLGRVERGEGTLGRLSTDEELYVNMNAAAENLNALLTELQENPRKYFSLSIF
ncbi:MAG: MlaD family protein [Gemmatimonadota bacterium]|nr:MlaD family protein [Gemmatimonadota bacterium]